MKADTIKRRLEIIEQIPSWSCWWLAAPPTAAQRVITAVSELRKDIALDLLREIR